MNLIWRRGVIAGVLILAGTAIAVPGRLPAKTVQGAAPAACASAEYRQFDFWVGDWDVFDIENPKTIVARVHVNRILDGCVLHEDYQSTDGVKGQSFSIYDAMRKAWHQSWVTNRGAMLEIQGNMEGTAMVLSGADRTPDGKDRQVRGVWKPVSDGVREMAVRSTDGGKTWMPWFDLIFRTPKP